MVKIRIDGEAALNELHQHQDVTFDATLLETVSSIKEKVLKDGDAALIHFAKTFDKVTKDFNLIVGPDEIKEAYTLVSKDFISAIKKAITNITQFHKLQKPKNWTKNINNGSRYGVRYSPLESVGLYVPGGRAIYPSTVLMNSIPAKIAGVPNIVITTPPQPNGKVPPEILVAADLCGVSTIIKSGGAQAVFALAYGTTSVPKIDKIVGPGNRFVTLAKQMVYGRVDIDKPAGPSEVLVYIDNENYTAFAAAEALAQLEHDPSSNAVIISSEKSILEKTLTSFYTQLKTCSRQAILDESQKNLLILHAKNEEECLTLINKAASEHVVILSDHHADILPSVKNGGSIFLGPYTPVTLGDYWAGPNHVLPTAGTARFSSPLGVMDFLKFSSTLFYTKQSLEKAKKDIKILTDSEGFDAHYKAVSIRLKK
jgi:histidinol dehydrogenase